MNSKKIFELGRKNYKIYQPEDTFAFGIDSVLLSWYAKNKKNDRVLDIGTGTGIIPILMKARYDGDNYFGIDIIDKSVEFANESAKLNGIETCVRFEKCDLKDFYRKVDKKYDVVTSNPPYMVISENSKNEKITCRNKNLNLEVARHEIYCTIEDVVIAASRLLKSKGTFYIVYKPDRLVSLLYYMRKYKIEPKKIKFVKSYTNSEANIVLVEGKKDGKESLIIENELIVYESEGVYTKDIMDIYYN